MEALKDSYHLAKLPTTSPGDQYTRQRISDDWEPNGFERYAYQQALLRSMSVLGGSADQYGSNPDRFIEANPKEAEFPVGKPTKKKRT